MSLEWLKEEIEKEVRVISQAFGVAEERGKTELEVLKSKALQDSKALEQFLKNMFAKEEMELKYIKTTLTKDINLIRNKLTKFEKKEKQKMIIELNKLKQKIKERKIKHTDKKIALKKINMLQISLPRIKIRIDQIKELIEKTKVLTKKEGNLLIDKIKEKQRRETNLLHKEIEELNKALQSLKIDEKTELQIIKTDLGKDVKKIKEFLHRSKIRHKEVKKSVISSLEKAENVLKITKVKGTKLEKNVKFKVDSLQKSLDAFIIKEKEQTLKLVYLTLAKLKRAKVKAKEEEKRLKGHTKSLFKKKTGLQWLKKEVGKEISMIGQAFGRAEEKGKTELEALKNEALQESKILEQFLKNLITQEEIELGYIKRVLKEEVSSLQNKLAKLEKREKQELIKELNRLKIEVEKKRIRHPYKKKAIEKINRLQSSLPRIKIRVSQVKKLVGKARILTEKEKVALLEKIKAERKKDTDLFYKEIEELNKTLRNLKRAEKTEVQTIKTELEEGVRKVKKLLQKSKTKNKELKRSAYNDLKKIEGALKTTKAKEAELKRVIKHKADSLEKNLDAFIIKEKEQTLKLVHLTLAKLKEAEVKTGEEEKGLENYIKKLFKKKKKKTEADLLKEAALKKLKTLEKKRQFTQEVFDDFVWVLKVFLSNYLGINYEYTHQELINELIKKGVKHKEDIIKLSEDIQKINYEGDFLNKEHFKRMVEEAKRIIREV